MKVIAALLRVGVLDEEEDVRREAKLFFYKILHKIVQKRHKFKNSHLFINKNGFKLGFWLIITLLLAILSTKPFITPTSLNLMALTRCVGMQEHRAGGAYISRSHALRGNAGTPRRRCVYTKQYMVKLTNEIMQ
jgi:hypothetical protein